jgi:hypothetical protein
VAEADVVLRHVDGYSFERFAADPILSRAALRSLMIIGEAANRVPVDADAPPRCRGVILPRCAIALFMTIRGWI